MSKAPLSKQFSAVLARLGKSHHVNALCHLLRDLKYQKETCIAEMDTRLYSEYL